MKVKIFGCKVNKYFTDKWMSSDYLKDKSGIFIATCVVTDNAKRKWVKFVKDEIKNLKNQEKVFISGCGTLKKGELSENFYKLYPELEKFDDKLELLGEEPTNKDSNNNLNLSKNLYTKKFILIQSGCDNYCTFCLTVIKRGKHFYRKKEDILQDILDFEKEGGKEIVLTGINLGAWGLKNTNEYEKSRFGELLTYILKNSKIPRIRISSLGPEFVNDKTLELFKNKRIYPHFHYSVQSGSTDILKKMNRNYNKEYVKNLILKTKNIKREDKIDISVGADIIVGFPGETEKDFDETYNLIKETGIQKVHTFPFSAHNTGESVPAGNFKNQVNNQTKTIRLKKLKKLTTKIRNNFLDSQIGKTLEVLIEKTAENKFKGWTQNYIEAQNKNFEILSGKIKKNEIIIGKLK